MKEALLAPLRRYQATRAEAIDNLYAAAVAALNESDHTQVRQDITISSARRDIVTKRHSDTTPQQTVSVMTYGDPPLSLPLQNPPSVDVFVTNISYSSTNDAYHNSGTQIRLTRKGEKVQLTEGKLTTVRRMRKLTAQLTGKK